MMQPDVFAQTRYAPHEGQRQFHASGGRFKVLIAGARFGKSLAAAKDVLADPVAAPTRGWVVAPTYAMARPEFEAILDDLRARLHVPLQAVTDGGRSGPSHLVTPWGAEVWCLSALRPQGLLGQSVDWLVMAEAAHIDGEVFERYLRARLSSTTGRMVVPTTPRGLNWVHDLYNRATEGDPEWHSFRFATWDNPLVPAAEIESARRVLPAKTFDEQYGGAFTTVHGLVYREFSRTRHVAPITAPEGAVVYRAIDAGYTNATCCLWACRDADDRLLVLREHYLCLATADRHAAAIHAIDAELEAQGLVIGPAWIDPSGVTLGAELAKHNIRTSQARNDLHPGIECVRMLLAGDGKPRLVIDPRCVNLLREIEGYRWQDTSRHGERVPVKQDDHALDALRYLAYTLYRNVVWQKVAPV